MYHYGDRSYGEPDYSHLDANEEGPEDFTLAHPSDAELAQAKPAIVKAIEEAFAGIMDD